MSVRVSQEAFNVLGKNIKFDIHFVTRIAMTKRGDIGGVRNDRDLKCVNGEIEYREADAVDRATSFFYDVSHEVLRYAHNQLGNGGDNFAHGINVTKNYVATKTAVCHHGALEVDRVAGLQVAKVGAGIGFVRNIGNPPIGALFYKGEAAAIDGN